MSIENQGAFDQAVRTLIGGLGVAEGSLVYTDGRIDIKALQTAFRESKCGISICGISNDCYASAREIVGWSRFRDGEYIGDTEQVTLVEVETLGKENLHAKDYVPEGAKLYCVALRADEKESHFYAVLGIPRPDRKPRRDGNVVRGNRVTFKDGGSNLADFAFLADDDHRRQNRKGRHSGKKGKNRAYDHE